MNKIRAIFGQMGQRRKQYIKYSLLLLFVAAFLLTFFLEYRAYINNLNMVWFQIEKRPLVFIYNSLLMFVILLFFTGLTNKPVSAIRWVWILICIITYVHINKFISRGSPLLPDDFTLIGEVGTMSQFVSVISIVKLLLAIAIIVFLTIVLQHFWQKKFPAPDLSRGKTWWRRHNMPIRVFVVLLSVLLFFSMTSFARNNKGERYEYIPWLNSTLTAWNQQRNYDENGFIIGFCYNLQKLKVQPPDGYSEEKISEIKKHYKAKAKAENADRMDLSELNANVVVILNESFYDPDVEFQGKRFRDYYQVSDEVLPNLHRIQRQYPSGNMYSIDYGGGTANVEFEVLTNMTNHWLQTVPYTALIPRDKKVPSLASYFKKNGWQTTAIHPYSGGMYKRNIVYPKLGIDKFITEKDMKYFEKEGTAEYINDRSAYNQTLDVLKSSKKKQFINLVTMQNHLPYSKDIYNETHFSVLNSDAEVGRTQKDSIATYFEYLHNSDAYLGEFINQLEKMDEKTVVLFYGDHSAGIFDLVNNHEEKEVRDLARLTPYFIYSNFDLNVRNKDLPTTTPNQLGNTLLDLLNVKKTTLNYLADDVEEQAPILTTSWFDNRGLFNSTELSSYQLVTYDILSGKNYWSAESKKKYN